LPQGSNDNDGMVTCSTNPPPSLTALADLDVQLHAAGYAVLDAASFVQMNDVALQQLQRWDCFWQHLPPDAHLRDGGRYRRRRHGSFIVDDARLTPLAHRAHWQPLQYNALHGGFERWFEPLETALVATPAWERLIVALAGACSAIKGAQPWYVEAHQFRIDTTNGIGRPTPEGAHRDGVDFVAVILVSREGVKGGETRIFEADGPAGLRFTLTQPWTTLLLDDERVVHETTPIQPAAEAGHRDTLVLTFRAHGFQDPAAG
jgi:hypothetical protein